MIQTTLDVRVSWAGVLAGGFSIGVSKIDSTDKFTTAYDAVFGQCLLRQQQRHVGKFKLSLGRLQQLRGRVKQ